MSMIFLFVILILGTNLNELFDLFNSLHSNLKFTREFVINNQISFLDVLVIKNPDNSISCKVFRKSTWKNLLTHFNSFVPFSYKIGLIKSLFYRAYRICTEDLLSDELNFLFLILTQNGYPKDFISRYSKVGPSSTNVYGPDKKSVFIKIPFNGDFSFNNCKKRISSQISKVFPQVKICTVAIVNKIWSKSTKDKLPMFDRSHVIYRFDCKCGSSYIGLTRRCLKLRIKEHLPSYLFKDTQSKLNTRKPSSSIAKHLINCNHRLNTNFNNFSIVASSISYIKLNILEALYISTLKPNLCIHKDIKFILKLNW